jgi:hypothetical protein
MTDNTMLANVKDKDVLVVTRAQNRWLRAYRKVRSWRKVGELLGVNQRYVWELCLKGIVPTKPELRCKLGLPCIMPSERKTRIKKPIPLLGSEGWEGAFFKTPRNNKYQAVPTETIR